MPHSDLMKGYFGQREILENSLIELKEWAEGALTKPSALANDAFFYMEVLFMTNRDTYKTQKGILKPIVNNIVESS